MDNYPAGAQHYTGGNSPFAGDGGLEDAHIEKIKEVEEDNSLIAEIISELSGEKYTELTTSINSQLNVIGRFMSDALSDSDCDAWQEIIVKMHKSASLPVEAGLIVEEAISAYAMKEALDSNDNEPEPDDCDWSDFD